MQQFFRLVSTSVLFSILLISNTFAQTLIIVPEAGYDTCSPFPLTLLADTTGIGVVEWSNGSMADSLVIYDYGDYSVSLTTLDTVIHAEFSIAKVDCCHPALPNAFTPNGDGINDQFGVILRYCDVEILEFNVYSRWGELMFQAQESSDRWDGTTLNGTEAPSDTYIYVARYKVADETEEKNEKGNVVLLR